ncbi:hypothetical protein Tco_0515977, partial [Tanacetum coccineum]
GQDNVVDDDVDEQPVQARQIKSNLPFGIAGFDLGFACFSTLHHWL